MMAGLETLFPSKFLAIAANVLFVAALTGYYYVAESGFNPNPETTNLVGLTACSASLGACPGFSLSAVRLTVTSFTDATSQELTFAVLATTPLL